MDGNHSPQHRLQGQAPRSSITPPSQSSTSAQQRSASPRQQPSTLLQDSVSEHSTFAVTSSRPERFPFENSPVLNDNIFGLSWSPNSKDSSASPVPGDSSTQLPGPQLVNFPTQSTSASKRKRNASPTNPPPPNTNPPTSTSATKEHQPVQKRQRRSKATKPKFTSRSKSADNEGSINDNQESESNEMGSERPRLTEQEKKNNHIASEQKRRLAIREGFDRLTEIVPGLEGQGRSESVVLKKSVDHMRDVLHERQQLVEKIQALGGQVPPELR